MRVRKSSDPSIRDEQGLTKIWIFICLCSLLFWIVRLIPDGFERFYNVVFVSWDYYYRIVVWGWMYSVAAVGLAGRSIGVILGLVSLFMAWKDTVSFLKIKKWVAAALSLESFYYVSTIEN